MKISATLALFAAIGFVATALGIAIGFAALPLFAATVSTLLLLIVVTDYSARPRYVPTGVSAQAAVRARLECMPLAA